MVEALLQLRADVNATDQRDMTPLHHAAGTVAEDTMRVLLDAGADVRAQNTDGRTPLGLLGHRGAAEGCRVRLQAMGGGAFKTQCR